jgi:predicted ATP-dependent Lon-type protease
MKLLLPDSGMALTYPVEYVVDLALRPRRRVKEQQRQVQPEEYGDTAFRYRVDGEGEMKEAVPAELEPSRSGSSGSEMVSPG